MQYLAGLAWGLSGTALLGYALRIRGRRAEYVDGLVGLTGLKRFRRLFELRRRGDVIVLTAFGAICWGQAIWVATGH